jgi:hypothetical protein
MSCLVDICRRLGTSNFFVVDKFVCKSSRTKTALLCIGRNVFLVYVGFCDNQNYFLLLLKTQVYLFVRRCRRNKTHSSFALGNWKVHIIKLTFCNSVLKHQASFKTLYYPADAHICNS